MKSQNIIEGRTHKQISLHFTIKGQDVADIKNTLRITDPTNALSLTLDECERKDLTIIHTFLSRKEVEAKGFSTGVVDLFDWLNEDYTVKTMYGKDLVRARSLVMGSHITNNGMAVFIGKIIDGVKEEYDLAIAHGIPTLCLPLVPSPKKKRSSKRTAAK